jgi:hypothetical protein
MIKTLKVTKESKERWNASVLRKQIENRLNYMNKRRGQEKNNNLLTRRIEMSKYNMYDFLGELDRYSGSIEADSRRLLISQILEYISYLLKFEDK